MSVFEGDQPARAYHDPFSSRRFPENVTIERPGLHVQSSVKTSNIGMGKPKWFIVHIQLDDLGIRDIDNRLPRGREAIGVFGIGDGPALIKAIDECAVLTNRSERHVHQWLL